MAAKRKRGEVEEEEVQERELERLRRDGMRRRRERAEMLRRQAEEEEREAVRERDEGLRSRQEVKTNGTSQAQVQDIDRVVKLRFPMNENPAHLTRNRIVELFSRFGAVEAATLKEKKMKVDGEKHRKAFMTVAVIFENIVGAHAAISDFPQVAEREQGDWKLLETPEWASGKEPEVIPNGTSQAQYSGTWTPTNGPTHESNGDVDDILMIRLKNAEKKRREDKKRKEEEAAAAAVANGDGEEAAPPTKRPMPTFASFKAKAAPVPGEGNAERTREAEKKRLEEELRREEEAEERVEANGTAA